MGRVKEALDPIMERLTAKFLKKNRREPDEKEEAALYEEALRLLAAQLSGKEQFWLATMESSKYTWTGVGRTEQEAIGAIRERWNKHINRIPPEDRGDALTWEEHQKLYNQSLWDYCGGWVRLVTTGHGYMDHEDDEDWRRLFP